jgi:ribokinase
MDWDVVVLGGANYDYLVRGDALPAAGETLHGEAFDEAPGGKGANQAVGVARLGSRVAFCGRVGADERGRLVEEGLRAEGVDVRALRRDPDAPTGVALVMVDRRGQKQIAVAPGANARVSESDLQAAAGVIQRGRVLLLQLELPVAIVEEAANMAKADGRAVVLDAGPACQLSDRFLARIDVLRANGGEAEALTGIEVRNFAGARRAAQALLDRGVRTAVVGAGDEGDVLLSSEGELLLPRFAVNAVDATGAGDAFAAALAMGLSLGRPWSEVGPFASASAALKTTKLGAQAGLPRRQEIVDFLRLRSASRQAKTA